MLYLLEEVGLKLEPSFKAWGQELLLWLELEVECDQVFLSCVLADFKECLPLSEPVLLGIPSKQFECLYSHPPLLFSYLNVPSEPFICSLIEFPLNLLLTNHDFQCPFSLHASFLDLKLETCDHLPLRSWYTKRKSPPELSLVKGMLSKIVECWCQGKSCGEMRKKVEEHGRRML